MTTLASLAAKLDKLHAANAAKRELRQRRRAGMTPMDFRTRLGQMHAAARQALDAANTPQPRDARMLELLTSASARRDLDIA